MMVKSNFKADFGFYLSKKLGPNSLQHFYNVAIFHLIHVNHNMFTFTTNVIYDNEEFAASFDFTIVQFRSLIEQIENKEFAAYLDEILNTEFRKPEQVDFTENPIIAEIDAQLGKPVKSLYETFVPLIVEEFSNVRQN